MSGQTNGSLTSLLLASSRGDEQARGRLWEIVYAELRGMAAGIMARERPGHTLQPTALVNQAFVRLLGGDGVCAGDRSYFFGAAAQAMRRILIEHARRHRTHGHREPQFILEVLAVNDQPRSSEPASLDALDESLDELEQHHSEAWAVIMHRFFAGLSVEDTATCLKLSPRTVNRLWTFGRTWLYDRVTRKLDPPLEDSAR